MQLTTHRRRRAAVGAVAVAATAGTAFLAAPAAAADDPTAGISCQVTHDRSAYEMGVSCYDDVASEVPTVVSYQWERDGVAIPGATGGHYSYRLKPEEVGHLFSATVRVVGRDGTELTIPIGRASAPDSQARYLTEGCWVTSSHEPVNPDGSAMLTGASLNDTLTLAVTPEIADTLTVSGPYWSMATASSELYQLPPALAEQGQGWTVRLSDLASVDSILGRDKVTGRDRGEVVVYNSFTVHGGDVSATLRNCTGLPEQPWGQLDTSLFGGPQHLQTPSFPIAGHAAGDTGVRGVLTADTSGWGPAGGGWDFTYQWTRDGHAIAGATSDSYTLTGEDSGKKVGLVVRGTKDDNDPWAWGEVTVGQIKADATAAATAPPAASSSTAAGSGSTVPRAAAGPDAKTQSGSPAALAKTGGPVRPVVGLAALLLAAGVVAVAAHHRTQPG